MCIKDLLKKIREVIYPQKPPSSCPKCWEIFGIVEKVIVLEELSEDEWEEIQKLLEELDD